MLTQKSHFLRNCISFFFSHALLFPSSTLQKWLPTHTHALKYAHTHTHAHIKTHTYTHTHARKRTCTHTNLFAHTYTLTCAHLRAHIHINACMNVRIHAYAHIYLTILQHFSHLILHYFLPQGSYQWTNWDVFLYLRMLGRPISYRTAWWACKYFSKALVVRSLVAAFSSHQLSSTCNYLRTNVG